MATLLDARSDAGRMAMPAHPLAADRYERMLAYAAVLLLAGVAVALARGFGEWGRVPAIVWAHLATIIVALALTPAILLGARGTARHRRLGTIWVAAMIATAALSLFVHHGPGRLGPIHLLSLWVLVQVPLIWRSARRHDWRRHRAGVRGLVTGALLIAGFFTFPFGRLLGHWLFA